MFITNSIVSQNSYQVVYKSDKNGIPIFGNLNDLLGSIENGNPVRVGWTVKFVDFNGEIHAVKHWANAAFLTLVNGQVYAQVQTIFEQAVNFNDQTSAVLFVDGKPNGWVSIISSTGVMKQSLPNLKKDTIMTDEEFKRLKKALETISVETEWAIPK